MGCFELKKGWIVISIKLYRVLKIEPYHRLLRVRAGPKVWSSDLEVLGIGVSSVWLDG